MANPTKIVTKAVATPALVDAMREQEVNLRYSERRYGINNSVSGFSLTQLSKKRVKLLHRFFLMLAMLAIELQKMSMLKFC